MTLTQGIVYYVVTFIIVLAFVLAGCFLGATLRKIKDKKDAAQNDVTDSNETMTE